MGEFTAEEKRIKAIHDLGILDTIEEKEFDDIVELASILCGTKIALISFVDSDRQWFKSSKGLTIKETAREFSFCAHAIENKNSPFIIEDAKKDKRFSKNPLVTGSPNIHFYAGIPLVDKDDNALGTLCVIDDKSKKISKSQIDGLQILSRNVLRILELRKNNLAIKKENEEFGKILDLNNPFFLLLNESAEIILMGSKIQKIFPEIELGMSIFSIGSFLSPFDFQIWKESPEIEYKRLAFFESHDNTKRLKFSASKSEKGMLISAVPLINSQFSLKNYNLYLNDFKKHDYIAEYIFLQQTSDRALTDSKRILDSMVQKNEDLVKARSEIESLARFPGENPNPIIRIDYDLNINYRNASAEGKFSEDFNIIDSDIHDEELNLELKNLIDGFVDVKKMVLIRNNRHYNISLRNVHESGYINLYASDITSFMIQILKSEEELKKLNHDIEVQKEFYEFILNKIPADIAVFNLKHEYIYINPQGVKNDELRNWLIGKTDFDYCELKNVNIEVAKERRKAFNQVMSTEELTIWEDEFILADGSKKIVQRFLGPLFDDHKKVRYVIGYGMDITSLKLAQENLISSNKQLKLLENFLNKSSDAIQVADEFGQMIYINETASTRLGIPVDRLNEYNLNDFETYFQGKNSLSENLVRIKQKGTLNIESENINIISREKTPVEVSMIFEEIDGKGYLIAASRDITERKKTEEEVRKLSLVAKNTTNGVLILNPERIIVWANDAIVNRSEYSLNELIGQSPKLFQFEGTNQETIQRIYNSLVKVEPVQEEILHATKTGKLYWISLNIQPIFDSKGELEGYIALELDITERKKFEETIAEQNKELKEITDALDQSALVSIADTKGLILKANSKFCEVAGYTEEELIGQNHNIVNSRNHDSSFWKKMWNTIRQGKIWREEVCNKKKNGELYWVDSIIYPVFNLSGEIKHFLSIRHEITDRKLVEAEIERKAELQQLLVKISSDYINIPLNAVEASINKSMAEIGAFVRVDRVYIFDYNHEKRTTSNLYEWCSEGIEPQIEQLQNVPFDIVPVWVETHSRGESIIIRDINDVPPSNFREMIEVQGIQSLVAIPMMDGNTCIGFVGFDSVRNLRSFTSEEQDLLELYAQMLVNVSQRTDYLKQIQQAKNDIEEINKGLELQVQEKTKTNLELAKSISDQEKLVTIGEIASGIAHDLNTPLGAIKSGVENIRFTLNNLLKDTIWKCTEEQIQLANKRASEVEVELFVGGLKQRRELGEFKDFICSTYPNLSEEKIDFFANAFVKNRIKIDEVDLIEDIILADNSSDFLDLLYYIQITRNFIDTILTSGERATQVINDLRSFIKEKKSSDKGIVNLNQNISTVLNIFNYELKKNVDVQFNVDPKIEVYGIDIKLFQLWSNLIKNAIESMNDVDRPKLLKITSFESKDYYQINVENNGPVIPAEIKEKIFEKFYTTKGHKNGSGLGLSIVSSVIQEHDALLELESNELVTKFIIKFKK